MNPTRLAMIESLVTGIMGTFFGLGFGFVVLIWLMNRRIVDMVPEVCLAIALSTFSIARSKFAGFLR
jgi:ABC-type lipoprotein release transport system permease subunit